MDRFGSYKFQSNPTQNWKSRRHFFRATAEAMLPKGRVIFGLDIAKMAKDLNFWTLLESKDYGTSKWNQTSAL